MSKKDKVEMKRYTAEKPTDKAVSVVKALIDAMVESGVDPEEVLPVLGEAVIRFLVPMAETMGYGRKEIVKVFGDGLATAEIELDD